jgi:tRNA pseudouridine38-40 synthase
MIAAAPVFEGEHDFRSFAASADPSHDYGASASYVRTVYASRLLQESNELVYWIKGNGFLHHMVRNIVGFLIDIGCGLKRVDDVGPLFGARQRSAAGRMAPARGLYLECVSYSDAPRA